MTESRRLFLRDVSRGVLGSMIAASLPSCAGGPETLAPPPPGKADSEEYWKTIRDRFPLTHDRIYLNNGTVGPSPDSVIAEVSRRLAEIDRMGEIGSQGSIRKTLAVFMHADEDEISITHNATEGINILAWGLPLGRGDEVIITTQEHAGNALPWLNRARLDGIVLKPFIPALTADATLNLIRDSITPRTRVIAVPHITCIAGHRLPVKEISRLGRDKGIRVVIDGAHGPGMLECDLHDLGCDGYAACCHKWMCGPKGTGFLYVRKEMLEVIQVRWTGAEADRGWDLTTVPPTFDGYLPSAHRYDFGTQNTALHHGVEAAVTFFSAIGMSNISRRSLSLASRLQAGLLGIGDRISMLTPVEEQSRAAMVGFSVNGIPYTRVGELAGQNGFRIRQVSESRSNSLRVSTHIYNSAEEVDRFVAFIDRLVTGRN